jgi:predicted kinase
MAQDRFLEPWMMIELLVGMIASGKSTYARKRARSNAMVVCHDDLTEMLHSEYTYNKAFRQFYRDCEEALVKEILANNLDAIIDRTHLTHESRLRWIDFAGVYQVPIVAVVFPFQTIEKHADRRFKSDNRGRSYAEWENVAQHHASQWYEEPLKDHEGFTEIRYEGEVTGICPRGASMRAALDKCFP